MIESRKIRDLSGLGSDVFRFTVRIGEAHVTIRQKIPTLSRNLGASRWKQRTGRIEVSAARDVPARDRPLLSSRSRPYRPVGFGLPRPVAPAKPYGMVASVWAHLSYLCVRKDTPSPSR